MPYFKLTEEIVRGKLREYVRNEFSRRITDENRSQLRTHWDAYITDLKLSEEGKKAFAEFNITPAQQEDFIASLRKKYSEQFDEGMERYVRDKFALNHEKGASPTDSLHVFKLDGIVNASQLFSPVMSDEVLGRILTGKPQWISPARGGAGADPSRDAGPVKHKTKKELLDELSHIARAHNTEDDMDDDKPTCLEGTLESRGTAYYAVKLRGARDGSESHEDTFDLVHFLEKFSVDPELIKSAELQEKLHVCEIKFPKAASSADLESFSAKLTESGIKNKMLKSAVHGDSIEIYASKEHLKDWMKDDEASAKFGK
jgi:hypothetical protein